MPKRFNSVRFAIRISAGLGLICFGCVGAGAQPGLAHGAARQPTSGKKAVRRQHNPGRPVNPLAPTITDIRPRHWDVGVPNPLVGRNPERITLAVIGKRFRPGASVLWNDRALRTRFRSAARLEANVPFGVMMATRPRKPISSPSGTSAAIGIRVRNPPGGHGSSNVETFKVVFVVVGG